MDGYSIPIDDKVRTKDLVKQIKLLRETLDVVVNYSVLELALEVYLIDNVPIDNWAVQPGKDLHRT